MDPTYFRAIERLVIVGSGTLSIVLGFFLFYVVSRTGKNAMSGEASATLPGISVSLKQVWPGTFFAAYGMIILIISMQTQLKFADSSAANVQGQLTLQQAGGLASSDPKTKVQGALTVIGNLLSLEEKRPANYEQSRKQLYAKLMTVQGDLIDTVYGDGAFNQFLETQAKAEKNPEILRALPDKQRLAYDEIRIALQR
jgi:hypothetical protein